MGLGGAHAPGATPLDPNEVEGLLPPHIHTQEELNEWEQANIGRALAWLASGRKRDVLNEGFVRELHRRMFDDTWRWAGRFRLTERNIGVAPEHIAPQLRDLLDDTRYWLQHGTYPVDEVAARFHHRLVAIHCFANGNGRHARLISDLLLASRGAEPFSWGRGDLMHAGDARDRYLAALRDADRGDLSQLMIFVRS
jgi:Fic-DOC domain mobile mystery protein B